VPPLLAGGTRFSGYDRGRIREPSPSLRCWLCAHRPTPRREHARRYSGHPGGVHLVVGWRRPVLRGRTALVPPILHQGSPGCHGSVRGRTGRDRTATFIVAEGDQL